MSLSSSMYARKRKETAVYWPPGPINRFGKQSVLAPIEIECRWEDRHDQFIDIKGQTQVSKAMIFADRVLELSGMLFLGPLISAPADPLADRNCWEIRQVEKQKNITARAEWYSAMV